MVESLLTLVVYSMRKLGVKVPLAELSEQPKPGLGLRVSRIFRIAWPELA